MPRCRFVLSGLIALSGRLHFGKHSAPDGQLAPQQYHREQKCRRIR
jgi:hypothetical protein